MQHTQDVIALHHRVEEQLARKLAPLDSRVVGPLSTYDIYHQTPKTFIVSAPPQFQLDWYFTNFDKIQQCLRPPKTNYGMGGRCVITHAGLEDKQLAKGIWYYLRDDCHSFSRFHRMIRANIFLALVVAAHPEREALIPQDAIDFALEFIMAWLGSLAISHTNRDFTLQDNFLEVWFTGKYDLVWLTRNQLQKLSKRMSDLSDYPTRAKCSWTLLDFIEKGPDLPREAWNRAGAALAYQQIVKFETEAYNEQKKEKADMAMAAGQDLGLGGLGFGAGEPVNLDTVNWDATLVRAVLSEDKGKETTAEQPEPGKGVQAWLPLEKVGEIVQTSVEDLADLLGNVSF